MPGGNILNIAR